MSPTVPTTTDPSNSWIRLGSSSLPSSTAGSVSNLIRADQSTRQHCEDDGVQGNRIADAYGRPLDMCNENGGEHNGNCWLLTHQSVSSVSLNGSWPRRDDHEPMTMETAEFWIHQLHSVLHETSSNLNLIVAFHHRQMQKRQSQLSSDLYAKPAETIMKSKSVAVQTNSETDNEKQMDSAKESKLSYHQKSVATPRLYCHSDCSIIAASPAVPSKPKVSTVSLDGCRFRGNSCCSASSHCCRTCKTPNRQKMPPPHRDESKSNHDRQWEKNINTSILLLNDAWQLAGLHTRQRMSILSRHYRILYRHYRRLRKRHRHLRRSMRRTSQQTRYIQHQLQILLESIVKQVDDVAIDWVDRLKGLVEDTTADGSSSDYSYSPCDLTSRSSLAGRGSERLKSSPLSAPTCNSFSLYRWYSSLSLKLSWIQTSHRNVIEKILLFQRISQDV
ncbi:uncharacterized protein LOC130696929 [Daphnia carinata]|uniref:uncharacterized protein LOC130696929 n=1 Tax=Daphnia carinata TaxID=120202 RepID=UPI00257BBDBF|nr:uncharacterized protein LOC130696929 [Daphnia carinata]